ncbi:4-hydroxyphenylpyruvate dioxygenase [Streptomyces sparsogenes]|uniref:4-hydroxyphenylpyruvate dioxygenase n=1 Tax=Streptomyces sparsogenes DSM 40356 TaxID=1331668 RepID=A0A1R1S9Q9_9ACTN|nr:4-hydroxyphenylpyruvate dioxygenase [Streptomyces sparsogenes]OMI35076.1 4-hydroxyphenylpyruvate dioxygenase [Streptomyces sparsogenes DSM 40356]
MSESSMSGNASDTSGTSDASDTGDISRTRHLTLNHLELYVPDAEAAAAGFQHQYGLSRLMTLVEPGAGFRSVALGLPRLPLLVTEGLTERHPASRFVAAHGAGVADIALRAPDARAAFAAAVARGAHPLSPPAAADGGVRAAVTAFGDVAHSFVQVPDGAAGSWVPGLGTLPAAEDSPTLLERVDHLAVCLPAGGLAPAVRFYREVLGLRAVFEERVEVGGQAMESTAVQNAAEDVTLTLLEPAAGADRGQISEFLEGNNGAGVQHIAFATGDIARSVTELTARGVEFLTTSGAYYDRLAARLSADRHPLPTLRELNILMDEDHDGRLYQIFTRSACPRRTLFFEVIERCGARTFGSGNIRALYQAVADERESARARR